ncbi:MAG TPA: hypothetical protein VL283_05690 [Candidatus Baltobacteraceae bacterium]|jgi:hypothetical protein|nr:hypothetical protein [Candidatus Baltobacteraceae bacterium]
MTDPDTIAAFNASLAAASDPMGDAVREHIEQSPADDDGIPKTSIEDVPTAPMRLPHDTIPNPFLGDEDWEQDDDEPTVVRRTTTLDRVEDLQNELGHQAWHRAFDPTGCMM